MLKGILTVGGWTMASRVLGFARDMLIAARLGAGPLADAFFVALQLPNLFRRLFGEGAFNAAFIPAFAGTLATQGPQAARDLAERMLALMAVWLSSLVLLGILLMPHIMALLARRGNGKMAVFRRSHSLRRKMLRLRAREFAPVTAKPS